MDKRKANNGNLPASVEQSEVSKAVNKSYKKYANGFQRPSVLLSLEPRMMFDGAAPAVVDDIIDIPNSNSNAESLPNPSTQESESKNESSQLTSEQDDSNASASAGTPNADEQNLFNQLTNNS